jgi:hypothetical protein
MAQYKMQAVDSVDGQLYYWLAASADFVAADYPGPNVANDVVVLAVTNTGGGTVLGSGAEGQVAVWSGVANTLTGSSNFATIAEAAHKVDVVSVTSQNTGTGSVTVDGTTFGAGTAGDVLFTAEGESSDNGPVHITAAGVWSRPDYFAAGSDASGSFFVVRGGATRAGTLWVCATPGPALVNADGLSFVRLPKGGDFGSQNIVTTGNATAAAARLTESSGVPSAVSDTTVNTRRTEDGADITRQIAGVYEAKLHTVTTIASTSLTTIADLYLENDRTAMVLIEVHAKETATPANRANAYFRLDVGSSGSTVSAVTANGSRTSPDGLPVTPPAWVGSNWLSLFTLDVATANHLKLQVTQAAGTSVKWTVNLQAMVTE